MNPRWIMMRRLRGPAFLLTFGLTAVMNQWNVLSFSESWPLYLIVAGVLTLLERAALSSVPFDSGQFPMGGNAQPPYTNAPQGWNQQPPPAYQPGPAAIVPVNGPVDPSDITPEGRR